MSTYTTTNLFTWSIYNNLDEYLLCKACFWAMKIFRGWIRRHSGKKFVQSCKSFHHTFIPFFFRRGPLDCQGGRWPTSDWKQFWFFSGGLHHYLFTSFLRFFLGVGGASPFLLLSALDFLVAGSKAAVFGAALALDFGLGPSGGLWFLRGPTWLTLGSQSFLSPLL